MTPMQRFADEHGAKPADVRCFATLGEMRAQALAHECNGDSFLGSNPEHKNENARRWGAIAEVHGRNMTEIVQRWGFHHLDFGVGMYPTLQKGESSMDGTVMFPWD